MMESFEEYAEEVKDSITEQSDVINQKLADFERHMDEKVRKELDNRVKNVEKPMFQEITTENVIKPVKSEKKQEKKEKKSGESNPPRSAQAQQLEKMKKEREEKKAAEAEKTGEAGNDAKTETKAETIVRLYNEGNDEVSIAKQMGMTTAEITLMLQMHRK